MGRGSSSFAIALASALAAGGCGKEAGPEKITTPGPPAGASASVVDVATFPPSARDFWKGLETKPAAELVAPSTKSEAARFLNVREIGFGASTHRWSVGEGKGSCEFRVLVHHGETTAARFECRDDAFAYRDPPRVAERWTHRERLARLRAEAERVLGPRPHVSVPPSLVDDVRTLEAPLSNLTFGGGCGEDGQPTEGFLATKRIVAAGRLDILRAVARGLSPEGRLFAADALLHAARGGALGPEDREIVERLRQLPDRVWTCSGCIHRQANGCAALAEIAPKGSPPCKADPPEMSPETSPD